MACKTEERNLEPGIGRKWDWESPIPDAIDSFGEPKSWDDILDRLQDGYELWVSLADQSAQNFLIQGRDIQSACYLSANFAEHIITELHLTLLRNTPIAAIYGLR